MTFNNGHQLMAALCMPNLWGEEKNQRVIGKLFACSLEAQKHYAAMSKSSREDTIRNSAVQLQHQALPVIIPLGWGAEVRFELVKQPD